MSVRLVACTLLTLFGVLATATSLGAAKSAYTPAICYLAARMAIDIKKLDDHLGVIFVFSWPPECQGPSNKLLQKSPGDYDKAMVAVFSKASREIEKLGYEKLPTAITFSVKSGCPKTWSRSGKAIIRQSDFKLELSIFAETFKGAIVQNHVVFTVLASEQALADYYEPLYGDWKTNAVVLRNNSRKCQIRLDAR